MIKLQECVEILDSRRIPLSSEQRKDLKKIFPYYGAQGIIDYVDNFLFDGEYILVAEDGNNLKSLSENIATWATGKFWVNNHAHILGPKTGYNLKFIYYLLNCMDLRGYITGSAQPKFNQENLANVLLDLPDKETQDRIANLLSAIDAKIENNSAICADLEGMAKLLYDYWFVQFDFPDENGKPYKSSGGKMVWNEELKREIPEGWEVLPLSAFIKTSKNGDWGNETPQAQDDIKVTCFRGADFPSITSDYSLKAPVRYIKKTNESRILKDGDLVVEISGGSPTQSTGRIGYINSSFLRRTPNEMVCSNFCKAFTLVDTTLQFWFYQTWKRYYDAGAMFHHESKTTGIKNLMFDEFVSEIKVPVPKNRLFQKYAKLTNILYDKTQECFIEASELASLRDFLLPMLMNGQVKVKETIA